MMDHVSQKPPEAAAKIDLCVSLVCGIGYLCFWISMVAGSLWSWFSDDDLMDLYYCWERPAWSLIAANLLLFPDYVRPMGEAFYKVVHVIWGFTPFPFHAFGLALALSTLVLQWFFVRGITQSATAPLLVWLGAGFNASFVQLYYDTGMIYDVLAFLFYFAALLLYRNARRDDRAPPARWCAAFIVLQIAAVNSKEIAATLPAALILHDIRWRRSSLPRTLASWKEWCLGKGRLTLLSASFMILMIVQKAFAAHSLLNHPAYRPQVSFAAYCTTYSAYLKQFTWGAIDFWPEGVISLMIVIFAVSAGLRDNVLIWSASMIAIGILPLSFIPVRGGFAFYVPAFFWIVWSVRLADIFASAIRTRLRSSILAPIQSAVILLAAAWILLPWHSRMFEHPRPHLHTQQNRNKEVDSQLHRLAPAIPAGTKVLFLNDPFPPDAYTLLFLMRLSYNDKSLTADRVLMMNLYGQTVDRSKYDLVFDYRDGVFSISKPDPRSAPPPNPPKPRARPSWTPSRRSLADIMVRASPSAAPTVPSFLLFSVQLIEAAR